MTLRDSHPFTFRTKAIVAIALALVPVSVVTCKSSGPETARPEPFDAGPNFIDCVDVMRVRSHHGYEFANVRRLGRSSPTFRTTARVADLSPADLAELCDWEACVRTNGYGHVCWVTDAGWERCRVCDGGADCEGRPMSREECVAQASAPLRAACHVGLLQECLIQRGLRGMADRRVTQTCVLADQTCRGELPGDLTAQALAAQHETDQVTIQVCNEELDLATQRQPDATIIPYWRDVLSMWEGGLPSDVDGGGARDF